MIDVLAIGAHPDDVELGCGGTMLRLRDAGCRSVVLDLTRGERGSRGTPETRAEEARRATEMMGLVARETLEFPDSELVPSLDLRRAVIEAIRRHRPRIVLAPLPTDLHPDHAAAGAVVRQAFYPSGMKNAEAAGEPFRPSHLFHYLMHDQPDTPIVVDVTSVWDERVELACCFASQLHAPTGDDTFPTLISRPDFLQRLEARARVCGRRAGVDFGEPLVVDGALAIADPTALFGRGPTEGAFGSPGAPS